jgi:hypothetical protein
LFIKARGYKCLFALKNFHGLYFCSRRHLWKVSLGSTCLTSFMHEMLYVCILEISKETGDWWLQAGRHQSGGHQWWQQSPKLVKNFNQFVKNSDSSPNMRHCQWLNIFCIVRVL